jgi:PAS domain S-box-containing protein
MASSPDYDATLRQVVWLAVPEFADWCAVFLVNTDASIAALRVASADPAQAELARTLERADLPMPGETPGVLSLLRSGRSVLMPQVGEEELHWLARSERHLRLLRAIGLRSLIGVPLNARSRQVGVLVLATVASGRTYSDADLAFAEQIASRCAMAVDNARLYREIQDALHQKEQSLALLDTLLHGAPDGLGFVDRELNWMKLNNALAGMLGAPIETLLGRSLAETGGAYAAAVRTLVSWVLETTEPLINCELSGAITPGQRPRHHLVSIYPVRNTLGELLGVGLVAVDITALKQTENELRESEERHRRLVETANEGIWLIDTKARTTLVNQRMATMLGYQPSEMVGRSVMDFAQNQALHRDRIKHNLAGMSEQSEFPFQHRDGSPVLALGGTSPLTNPQGEIVGALGMFSDITERKRAESERDRLLARERAARDQAEVAQRHLALLAGASELLASSLDHAATLRQIAQLAVPELADWCAVYLVESDETVRLRALAYANPAHAELARQWESALPVLPRGISHVLLKGKAKLQRAISDELPRAGAADNVMLRRLRSIGLTSTMHVPLRVRGRTLGVLTLATSDSGRQYGPADLRLAQQLADRCAVALDNAVLVRELRHALGVREELLAATSHELRTPLAHIKGFTSSLRLADIEWDEATRQEFLAEIEREADRLNDLIGDLLSMSRLESGAPELHPRVAVTAEALVGAGLDRARGLLRAAHVDLAIAPNLPGVVVDAARMEQVVANLVENAAKYGGSHAHIRVIVTRVEHELELAVEDDGPGIAHHDLEQVFDKFFRAQSTVQSGLPGTGLGLAICRAIVKAHGGRIWAENRPAGGARLVVRLPLEGGSVGHPSAG